MKTFLVRPIFLLLFILGAASTALGEAPDPSAILARIDMLTNLPGDFTGSYTAIKERAGEKPKTIQATMCRRDRDGQFLILVSAPQPLKGQGYLKIDTNLWFYDPTSRLFSHSSLRESWEDTDAMNSDFFRLTYARDYDVAKLDEGVLDSTDVYVLELKGKNEEVAYPFKTIWVRKQDGAVLRAEDYSLSKMLMRSASYPAYAKVGGQYIPSKMIFVDELAKGNRSTLTLSGASAAALPDAVFTKAYLERVSR